MKTILFQITAVQPLLLTSLQGDPNSSVSFDYIPGSMIRGALIGCFRDREHPGGDLNLVDERTRRLFFDGRTRFLNAYPSIEGVRALPVARSLAYEKRTPQSNVYNRCVATPEGLQLKTLGSGYHGYDQRGNLRYVAVDMLVNIHNQRDRPRGRGVEGQGALFRYESVAPGQIFLAAILCDHDEDADLLRNLLPERFWIGGSRSAGYGEATITVVEANDEWFEAGSPPQRRLSFNGPRDHDDDNDEDEDDGTIGASTSDLALGSQQLALLLASDMFLRDDLSGQPSSRLPLAEIGAVLGTNVALIPERSFVATTMHGGFNRTWGLPLPQRVALAAGSVLLLELSEQVEAKAIAQLEWSGLGERRAEGFGRVVCNWLPGTPDVHLLSVEAPALDEEPLTIHAEPARQIARLMADRILQQRMEHRLIELVERYQISGKISNTQLSRLRIIARRALAEESMNPIQRLLESLPSNAREQFAQARVGSAGLDRWLVERIQKPMADWNAPGLTATIADQSAAVTPELAVRYTLRLIMAMARLKVKEAVDA